MCVRRANNISAKSRAGISLFFYTCNFQCVCSGVSSLDDFLLLLLLNFANAFKAKHSIQLQHRRETKNRALNTTE